MNRSAKLTKSPDLAAGPVPEPKGPSQGQEISVSPDQLESVNRAAVRSPDDQPKSINSASKAVSSSSDSETEDVNVQGESEDESEDELPPPRNAIRAAIDETLDEYHMVLGKNETKRRQKADKADEMANQKKAGEAEKAVETNVGQKQAAEKQAVVKQTVVKKAAIKQTVAKNEVVIVGTLRYMPPFEIAEETGAVSARRIYRRFNDKLEPTTAVVLSFDEEPPSTVIVQHERFRTKPFIRQTIRCLNCQAFNHRQNGCRNHARCARCGRQHRTSECEIDNNEPRRCANCKGDHSAASPECPFYLKVKKAWKMVADEKTTYAKAMSRVVEARKSRPDSAHAPGATPDIASNNKVESRRADLIDATGRDARPIYLAAVADHRRPKYRRTAKSTCSTGCQTEPEVVTVQIQTPIDSACQTESTPEGTSTQTVSEAEVQTIEVTENFGEEDKYIIATMHDMINLLRRGASKRITTAANYQDIVDRFDGKVLDMIEQRGYWTKLNAEDEERERTASC